MCSVRCVAWDAEGCTSRAPRACCCAASVSCDARAGEGGEGVLGSLPSRIEVERKPRPAFGGRGRATDQVTLHLFSELFETTFRNHFMTFQLGEFSLLGPSQQPNSESEVPTPIRLC